MSESKDYPEHLNPFKRRSGIRGSFRELKSALRRTFRKSNDKKFEARQEITANKGAAAQTRHNTDNTVTLRHSEGAQFNTLFPRSRFTERVAKAKTFSPLNSNNAINPPNPFEEEEEKSPQITEVAIPESNVVDQSDSCQTAQIEAENDQIVPETLKRRHRRKKIRAPLPPNQNELSHLSVPDHHNSKWSINSYETDCSSYTYTSEIDQDINQDINQETHDEAGLKDLVEISNKIQNYCINADDPAENCNEDKDDVNKPSMPDLVVSAENDLKIVETEIPASNDFDENAKELINSTEIENEIETENNLQNLEENCDIEEKAHSIDDQNNNSTTTTTVIASSSSDNINFVESKTIFIAGSQDNLDEVQFNERKSIYISGSCDALDADLNEQSNLDDDNLPVPKIRKHKLQKDALLGIQEI